MTDQESGEGWTLTGTMLGLFLAVGSITTIILFKKPLGIPEQSVPTTGLVVFLTIFVICSLGGFLADRFL